MNTSILMIALLGIAAIFSAVTATSSDPVAIRDNCLQKAISAYQTSSASVTQSQADLAFRQGQAFEKLADMGAAC